MDNNQYYIAKDRVLPPSQDYELLRKIGLQYIEKYGSKLWTDYNPHDSGITTSEILSYVITELGYRTGFKINDLLADKDGDIINKTFFPANKIFTNAPLTEIDFRKMLLDIDGISNAWFLATQKERYTIESKDYGYYKPNVPSSETNERVIYLNTLDDKLTLQKYNSKGEENKALLLRGLNKVILELADDPELGDLNSTVMDYSFFHNEKWVQTLIVPEFSSWEDKKSIIFEEQPENISEVETTVTDNEIHLKFKYNGTLIEMLVKPYSIDELDQVDDYLKNNVEDIAGLYHNKKDKVKRIYKTVISRLNENRNLAEDFYLIETVNSTQIGICAKIEVEPDSNIVDVMAQIQIAINNIINPPVRFYTLSQMLDEGYSTEEIFDGPNLVHGFLKDEELYKAQLPTAIHASDIIAEVMKIEGVVSISEVLLTEYDQEGKAKLDNSNKSWCLQLTGQQNPIFSFKNSRLQLYKKNIPFMLSENNQMTVEQKVQVYNSLNSTNKMKKSDYDIPFPIGNYYQLDEYYSIQDEYPKIYGLGKNKLSDKVSEKRKAQVKQLKGYLHFYDQILADFFKQLYHTKDLLNSSTIKSTYFQSYLDENIITGEEFYSKDLYSDEFKLKLFSSEEFDISLYENKALFYDRRNRSLDHLIARFGENFSEYVSMMYQMREETGTLDEMNEEYEEIIQDKQDFINEYPELSSKRGLGKNYLETGYLLDKSHLTIGYFELNNLGGYERRVARLLGINDVGIGDFNLEILDEKRVKEIVFDGYAQYKCNVPESEMIELREWIIQNISESVIYSVAQADDEFYYIYLSKDETKVARLPKKFKTEEEAEKKLTELLSAVEHKIEKFFCIEHILLRPFKHFDDEGEDNLLLPVCLQDDCKDPTSDDPYSFKATIVLPGYLTRFKNITFRKYAEKIFRQEAPAHVLLKICWVNETDMQGFQEVYDEWRKTYKIYRESENPSNEVINNHVENHKALIDKLNNIHTIYPEGHLYDCQLSETSNPIILGRTTLGTIEE